MAPNIANKGRAKNRFRQQKSAFYNPFRYYVLLGSCIVWGACGQQPQLHTPGNAVKKPEAAQNSENKRTSPPKIIYSTSTNMPKVIIAGKPLTRIDTLKTGAPFFYNYGTEQGQSFSSISCSIVDKFGNLWLGSQGGGASRYNGRSFINYTTAQGLAGNGVVCIMQDSSGNIWFGTDGNGASRYDGKSFTNYTTVQGLPGNGVYSIMQDKSGDIWFGTLGGGVSRYNGKSFTTYTTAQGLAGNKAYCIIQDRAGDLWFGTGSGVSRYNGKRFINYTVAQGLAANNVNSMVQDKAGNIWFGTDGSGVSCYNGESFINYTTKQGLADNRIYSIMQDKAGNIWMGTGNGVSRYRARSFTNYTTTQGLAANNVNSITQDNDGSIWFGTGGGGESRYDGESFSNYTTAEGLTGNTVYSLMQDKGGDIWFGTYEGGASRYNGESFTSLAQAQGLINDRVYSLMQDNTGGIWFGTGGGASRYNGKSFTNFTKAQGLAANNVNSLMQDKAGNIWLGTEGGGASKYDGKSFTNYTTAQGLAGNTLFTIMQDNAGNIWFGTNGQGVSRYNGARFTNYTTAQGLAGNNVFSMMQDRAGNIWFGTDGGGASRYDGKSFTNYTTAQGLADNVIYAIAEDPKRNIIWFGTNLGLSGLKTGSLPNENKFEIFNKNTGYPVKDVNTNSLIVDNKGIVWAGCGDNKLIRFDYSALNRNTAPLKLQIENIKVNGEVMCWNNLAPGAKDGRPANSKILQNEMVTTFGKALPATVLDTLRKKYTDIKFDSITRFNPVPVNLALPYEDKNLTIDFSAIEPSKPKQVIYQYKLIGYDKDWSQPGNGTTAVFGNIPEGSYVFKLKALSPFGVEGSIEYKFMVQPPWYRTWWAYLLYAGLSISIIWCFVYYRSLSLLKDNRKLEEKVLIRTEEVIEQKEQIAAQRDNLEKAFTELKITQNHLIQSEKMASLGELTAGIAHEIQNPLNFVNNFSEVSKELMEELTEELNKGDCEEAIAISADVIKNLEKITHHGKRADGIVKGMLQHSKIASGTKELTNINALADEYIRLSYHALQTKDKSFNAEIITGFDNHLPLIDVVPQDIGRVLFNLFNNSFYAVNERRKTGPADYVPAVTVSTLFNEANIIIKVKDNGTGIPAVIKDKIMQPFFTTKPTGEGVGLGLSLSYDIVVKAHRGEIEVDSHENDFTIFIVKLPLA